MPPKWEENFAQVQALIQLHPELYVQVWEYRITHRVMVLALHKGSWPNQIRITCGDCLYFCGSFEDSLYRLEIFRERNATLKMDVITIQNNKKDFLLKCTHLNEPQLIRGGF